MKKMYDRLVDRIGNKKAELKEKQEHFSIMCHNEMNSSNFEKNAIGDLVIMQQLKSEIAELEHIKMLYEMQIYN